MTEQAKRGGRGGDPPVGGPRGAAQVAAEALVWLWVLGTLGYFYYSRKYLDLLSFLWGKLVG